MKTFLYQDALQDSTEYFNGDGLAARVFIDKYALRNQENEILENTPDMTHRRLAKEFARVGYKKTRNIKLCSDLSEYGRVFFKQISEYNLSELEEYIYRAFCRFDNIVPQGRVLSGLGAHDSYRSLSNCLRLPPPKDSYSSIMYSDTMLISAAKRGCGYGLGISNLRPDGTFVRNSAQSSTGATSFMHRYSFSTREVAQHGRRGACLIDIDVRHPNADQFILSKSDRTLVTGANISVKYTDEFFTCVENNTDFLQRFPVNADVSSINISSLEYDKLTDINGVLVKRIVASKLFELTVKCAHDNAEPGLFFWDRMKKYDPADVYPDYQIDGTNACGEQPMAVGDTCRLIVQNLFSLVKNPFSKNAELDSEKLYDNSYLQLFLGDILVDLEIEYVERILKKIKSDPEPDNEKAIEVQLWELVKQIAQNGRRVGCGITALGDMIAGMGLKYGSPESILLCRYVMKNKMRAELDASTDLAIIFGPFTGWNDSIEYPESNGGNDFYKFIAEQLPNEVARMRKFGRRNINWSTVAPCGSVSIMTQSTSGCEPLFAPYYTRRVKVNAHENTHAVDFVDQNGDSWREEVVAHPKIKDLMNSNNIPMSKDNVEKTFRESPYFESTANIIDWHSRVEMQGVLQDYTTSAISTTLNLKNDVSPQLVHDIYIQSWKRGLKGQTVYRDGCRTGVLITPEVEKKKDADCFVKRTKELQCDVYHCKIKGEEYFCIISLDDTGHPYEVFAGKNGVIPYTFESGTVYKQKRGHYQLKDTNGEIVLDNITKYLTDDGEALTRMVSMSLRSSCKSNLKYIVDQLVKVQGDFTNLSRAISRCLKKYIKDGEISSEKCPECGKASMVYESGCKACKECGFSAC